MKNKYAEVVREGKIYIRSLVERQHPPLTTFVIFTQARSGSTLLVHLLNSHPHIHCEHEILDRKVLFPKLYIRCRSSLSQRDVYGFKLMAEHLVSVQKIRPPKQFILDLYHRGYKIIHLKRLNIFRQALSHLYARYRDVFHHRSADSPLKAAGMHVDLDTLRTQMRNIDILNALTEGILKSVPHITIVYEDDLQDRASHQSTVDKISSYLGLASAPARTDLVKVTPHNLSDFVSNHEELRRFINKTGYDNF